MKTSEKKKKLVKDKEAEVSESPAKKQKVSHSEDVDSLEKDVEKKKKKKNKKKEVAVESDEDEDVHSRKQDGKGEQQSLVDVVSNLISPLNSRFDTVDNNIKGMSSRLDVIGVQVESRIDAKFERRFGSNENDVKQIKEHLKGISDSELNSTSYIRDMFLPKTQQGYLKPRTQQTPDGPKKPTNNQSVTSPPPVS